MTPKSADKKAEIEALSDAGEDTLYLLETYRNYDLVIEEEGLFLSSFECPQEDEQSAAIFETISDLLRWSAAMLDQSPLARALLKDAAAQGWKVRCYALTGGGYHINTKDKLLSLDHGGLDAATIGKAAHLRSAVLGAMIKGLREIWQETYLPDGAAKYKPEDLLMTERVRAADVDLIAVQCAWELRASSEADLWRYLLGADDGDLALVFACTIEKNPASLYDGGALSQAFTQWFEDDSRIEGAEHGALELLDSVLAECDDAAILGAQRLKIKEVECITALPDGLCYLKGRGAEILKNPSYAGLSNPINQAHLFQIVYDSKVCMAGGVPFRDAGLARKLFPHGSSEKH